MHTGIAASCRGAIQGEKAEPGKPLFQPESRAGRLLNLARGHTSIAEIPTVASVRNLEALRTGPFSLASRNGRGIRAGGQIPAGRSR